MNAERYVALKEEANKLLANRFIWESHYPSWLANPVLVKKKNNKLRTCANHEKIKALCDMQSPTKLKHVQSLNGQVAALRRFISKSTDKCVPFFNVLRGNKKFKLTEECELAFQQLKEYIGQAPLLSKPRDGEKLTIYLAITQHAISAVLVREKNKIQLLIYDVSKRLQDAESRYPQMEKLTYYLVITLRKLRLYFQAYSIEIITINPLRQVL
ncbi:hypothetical protein ACOSP7_014135 [Xanthoceras sorbifolium]